MDRRLRWFRVVPLLALFASAPLGGQVVPVDDAVYQLLRAGEPVGEEHVTVHRMGLGQDARIIGQSEIRLTDGSEMRPRLEATTDMRATTYQNKFTGESAGEVMISRTGRRLVARTQTASGESQREFRASDRTVILEPNVVLLYYFLEPWLGEAEAELTVLEPRSGRQSRMTLRSVGTERVRVGRRMVEAQHFRLEGGGSAVDVWYDEAGRIVVLESPADGFRAERRDP
jgi:hypothetical protein